MRGLGGWGRLHCATTMRGAVGMCEIPVGIDLGTFPTEETHG